jgi:hypothetical protein
VAVPKFDDASLRRASFTGFGRARSRLENSLSLLLEAAGKFVEAEGGRASIDDLSRTVALAIGGIAPMKGAKIDLGLIGQCALILQDLRQSAFSPPVSTDLEEEAREQDADGPAAALLDAHSKAETALQTLEESCRELAENLDEDGETEMPEIQESPSVGGRTPEVTVRVTSEPSTTTSRLVATMVQTLGKLGLPTDPAGFEITGDDSAAAGGLVQALAQRFEVEDSPIEGMRARLRRVPTGGITTRFNADLSGRSELEARGIALYADQLSGALDELEDLLTTNVGLDSVWIGRTRRAIDRQLEDIIYLSNRPSGVAPDQATTRAETLRKRFREHVGAMGLNTEAFADSYGDRNALRKAIRGTIGSPENVPVTTTEDIVELLVDAGSAVLELDRRLTASAISRSDSEIAFQLRRALDGAAQSVEAALMALETTTENAVFWQGIAVDGLRDNDSGPQNLADALDETLRWLEPLANRFGRAEFAYEEMLPNELVDLGSELGKIATALGKCVVVLNDPDTGAEDSFIRLIEGLERLTRTASELAHDLSGQPN